MSATETTPEQRALAREWLVMRIIVIGGFAVALLAGLWFGVIVPQYIQPRELRAAITNHFRTLLTEEAQVCTTALASAKNFGIVPQYGQLASTKLAQTGVQGRYACLAATHAAKYVMVVDLTCRNLKDSRCVSLYNISQADGTILYQRQR